MRRPARARIAAQQQAGTAITIPAPVKGWNARDPIAAMDPLFANIMDNMIPRSSDVVLRAGCDNYLTGTGTTVKSLMPYSNLKLFAATDSAIYDASVAGVAGAAVAALTSGDISHENFSTAGTAYLYALSGTDNPWLYNGVTWTSITGASVPALTGGPALNTLSFVKMFKHRLWFVQKNTTNLWYLAPGAIGGALTQFPVGDLLTKGGSVVACGNWTFDGGDGPDDYFAIVTTEGEVIIYQGTDPSSAATFGLVGVYYIGMPMSKKCLTKYGGDLLFLCTLGAFPLSKILQSVTVNRESSITSNIDNAFVASVLGSAQYYGWMTNFFPKSNLLIVNIPNSTDGTYSVQYVMNVITGGWARFTGWNASCFVTYKGDLYFGAVGKVVKAGIGTADFGANITGIVQQAYNYFYGGEVKQKQWTALRPVLRLTDKVSIAMALDVDFELATSLSQPSLAGSLYGIWDTSLWDGALWGPDQFIYKNWTTVAAKVGFCAAFRMQIATNSVSVTWQSTDFLVRPGGIL